MSCRRSIIEVDRISPEARAYVRDALKAALACAVPAQGEDAGSARQYDELSRIVYDIARTLSIEL